MLGIAEVLGHRKTRERDAHTHAGGFVHLAEDQRRLIRDTALLHFAPEVVALTAALADASEDGIAAVLHGDVVYKLLDKDCFADACAAEQTDLAALCVGLKKVDDLDAGLEYLGCGLLLVERTGDGGGYSSAPRPERLRLCRRWDGQERRTFCRA